MAEKAQADQERVLAETVSLQSRLARRNLDVKKAQALEISKRQQAQADKAGMRTTSCSSRLSLSG